MPEEMELEGEWVMGWPDRKRVRVMPSKDSEGRTIFGRSPVLDLEGMLTPTDAYYVIAQLNMPDPVHPDDFSFTIGGMVDNPIEYTLEEIRKLPGRTVRPGNFLSSSRLYSIGLSTIPLIENEKSSG